MKASRALISLMFLPLFAIGLDASSARAEVIHFAAGLSSAGVPVSFESHLTITGDNLEIVLFNTSAIHSQNPNDILGSYYFDIVNAGNVRPTLSYVSAVGDVWLTSDSGPDTLQTPNANLRALVAGDNTWQYKAMNPALNPFLGFGVGTVGNNNLMRNSFMGNIVDGMDYCIYAGDVTTSNLNNRLLVKDHITFTFSGLTGFTEADIKPEFAFGLGTAPDSLLTPEPATLALVLFGGLALVNIRRRKA